MQAAIASPRSKSRSTWTEPWATPPVLSGACHQAGEATCLVRTIFCTSHMQTCCRRAIELFTWVLGNPITEDQAMRCAKREPGRSWEAIESELHKLGT